MKRTAAVAVATLLAALLVASSAAADTIEVGAHVSSTTRIAFKPAGRAGDAEAARWIVRDRFGNAIGDLLIDCRWVTNGLRLCVGQLAMPLGAIAVLGASRTEFLGQLAVVGGTGRYVGADGTMLFRQTGLRDYVLSLDYSRRR